MSSRRRFGCCDLRVLDDRRSFVLQSIDSVRPNVGATLKIAKVAVFARDGRNREDNLITYCFSHCSLKQFTGLTLAARIACEATVTQAMTSANVPAKAKYPIPRSM